MKEKLNSIIKLIAIFSIIFNLIAITNLAAINATKLTDFSGFIKTSENSNISSTQNSDHIYFTFDNNISLDQNKEVYQKTLENSYYDYNFSIGFIFNHYSPEADMIFRISLESQYAENGTYLEGNYSKICSISLIGGNTGYQDFVYRVEFYPYDSYLKHQSVAYTIIPTFSEFHFLRSNGSVVCFVNSGSGEHYTEEYTANHSFGLNRTLDRISFELSMNSLECDTFTIDVCEISGELYDSIKEEPKTTLSTTNITLNIPSTTFSSSIVVLSLFVVLLRVSWKKRQ